MNVVSHEIEVKTSIEIDEPVHDSSEVTFFIICDENWQICAIANPF